MTTTIANRIGRMTVVSAMAQAKKLSKQYSLPHFVYQTGVNKDHDATFGYTTIPGPSNGVLVARFDATGKMY